MSFNIAWREYARALLAMASFCAFLNPTRGQSPEEKGGRGAVVGYASNVDAFPFYRCRFKVTSGTASSEAEAKAAKGIPGDSVEASAVKDGEREMLEVIGATPQPAADNPKINKGGLSYVAMSGYERVKTLRKGKASGGYDEMMRSVNLHKREGEEYSPFDGKVYCPLYAWYGDRGLNGPDRMLTQPAKYTPTFLGERTAGGRRLVGVRFVGQKYSDGSAHESESWLDPDQGYLPVEHRIRSMNSHPFGTGIITEMKEFRPGRFFPMRLFQWWPSTSPGKWDYQEVRVLELDVENRPTTKDLSIVLPAGTHVSGIDRSGYFKLKQDERLSPDDLDELFDKLEKSKTNPRMDTAIEHTADRRGWWVWPAVGGGAALILLGGWLWWRKRRLARRASP